MDLVRHTVAQNRTFHGDQAASTSSEDASQITSALFREIHKNAWLKKLPSQEKKIAPFPRKGDLVWVVFCVHDDTEAFLEVYADQKTAITHRPDWFTSLNNCLHVSPTICPQEDDYEFVVTLSSDLVRLAAPSWDLMMEWVEAIRSKLREMKILSPCENLYSKLPEVKLPLAPTRDPNSPLPPTPAGPASIVPGVEPVRLESANISESEAVSDTSHHEGINNLPPQEIANSTFYITQSEPPVYTRTRPVLSRAASVPEAPANLSSLIPNRTSNQNVTVIEVNSARVPYSAIPTDQGIFNFTFVDDVLQDIATQSESIVEDNLSSISRPYNRVENSRLGQEHSSLVPNTCDLYECVFLSSQSPNSSLRTGSVLSGTQDIESSSTSTDASLNGGPSRSISAREPSRSTAFQETERRLQAPPSPFREPGRSVDGVVPNRLTLRLQQVFQLQKEMLHPGGIRLQLRKKDCVGSIALVDAFGAVWIAGWKQKEHPMLYNALHIGDQVISIGGIVVQNAIDAQKLIRSVTSLYVEFIIRRVPFGRVFAIIRDAEGQSLGIVQEGNTAEIRDVLPGSPAARCGLSQKTKTCDGLSLTHWVLTEINGRPLNLFFKDGEVRVRLNAVGKEISILVQPFDLVKQIKKQLKATRGYKEYIVQ